MEATKDDEVVSVAPTPEHWNGNEQLPPNNREYDSDSTNTFDEEDDRGMSKIKPEVELKEETDGFVYKPDPRGHLHLQLVRSESAISNVSTGLQEMTAPESAVPAHVPREPADLKTEFVQDEMLGPTPGHIRNPSDMGLPVDPAGDDPRLQNSFPSAVGPPAIMGYVGPQKFINESFQVPPYNGYTDLSHQKLFSMDESSTFQARCCAPVNGDCCNNKINYQLQMNLTFCGGKQLVSQIPDGSPNNWVYNVEQPARSMEGMMHLPPPPQKTKVKDSCRLETCKAKPNDAELWQLYQDLLSQKKMEEKFAQNEEQRREKLKEIGRIRARLYRAKLKQNEDVWKRHKAMRAQKQREERLKLSEEQREKIKELARLRARKHREKLKENETAWKKYKEMRAQKQRQERLRVKEEQREEAERQELIRLAEQTEKVKELARERAKKHRERLKENAEAWLHYKEMRAQKKREERLTMAADQRERLKYLARLRARKYREKLKENAEEWRRYKEMRAQKQREERMKLNEEQREKAKKLARERAKMYREKKRSGQRMSSESENSDNLYIPQNWFDCAHGDCSNNCSVYFYHTYLQNVPKNPNEQ